MQRAVVCLTRDKYITLSNQWSVLFNYLYAIHHLFESNYMPGILDLVGNTPLVELRKIPVNKKVTIYGKLEGNNPGGSVKDRAAYGMIKGALDRGEIKRGDNLIEATSGNTGIALAM